MPVSAVVPAGSVSAVSAEASAVPVIPVRDGAGRRCGLVSWRGVIARRGRIVSRPGIVSRCEVVSW